MFCYDLVTYSISFLFPQKPTLELDSLVELPGLVEVGILPVPFIHSEQRKIYFQVVVLSLVAKGGGDPKRTQVLNTTCHVLQH